MLGKKFACISRNREWMILFDDTDLKTCSETGNEVPSCCWYVAYTHPKREQLAADNLMQQGFEAYLPLHRTFKKTQLKSAPGLEPMFPRYIFFRPGVGQSLSGARSTRGVAFVLSFGGKPAMLNEETLSAIRQFELHRSSVNICELSPIRSGARVRLSAENLCGIEGLVTSVSNKRVNVLIEILGGYRKVSAEHHQLTLA